MKYQLILKKFDLDLNILNKKLKDLFNCEISIDKISKRIEVIGNLDINKFLQINEIDKILVEEKGNSLFTFKDLREDIISIGNKSNDINLKIKTYSRITIPANFINKKLANPLKNSHVHINKNSENHILIELFKDKEKTFYRIFSSNSKMIDSKKNSYNTITVLIEDPRLIDEISDFLRLCLIFDLKLKVIHKNKKQFEDMLNKAKSITKGKLSDFKVEVVENLDQVKGFIKIGFTKHASKNENDLIKVLKGNNNFLFIFGNDLYGLSQETRDKLDYSFSLTPDKVKPLKANQALAYVLGIYSALNNFK